MLLTKWSDDASPLSVLLNSGDAASTTFSARISDLSDKTVRFSRLDGNGKLIADTSVNLAMVESWEYQDLREAPPETRANLQGKITAALILRMSSDVHCIIYELGGV